MLYVNFIKINNKCMIDLLSIVYVDIEEITEDRFALKVYLKIQENGLEEVKLHSGSQEECQNILNKLCKIVGERQANDLEHVI